MYGSDNEHLYHTAVRQAVASAMDGINATVFAYGQTASGKTYSMMGFEEQPGVIPQAVDEVFSYIRNPPIKNAEEREYLLRVSYMEIYNETIRDLLNPSQTDLRIHEDRKRGVFVSSLKEEIVTTPKQLMKIVARGESNRSVGATDFNEHSSRSHAILSLTIESRPRSQDQDQQGDQASPAPMSKASASSVTLSQLNLIDLAGSEKATDDPERRKEGSYINKSLLNLGTVISRITEGTPGHIPYRDSKLTRILQSSLSGQSRIAVIATVSPTAKNLEESLNTLKFAARIKRIVPKPEYTFILDDKALIQKYRREIEELRAKLEETSLALEKERQQSLSLSSSSNGLSDAERQLYEEQLLEARLSRTALKERIDHLTRLILTSSTISAKPILDWSMNGGSAKGTRSSVMLAEGLLPPADPVARASMMFDARTGRNSRIPSTMTPSGGHRATGGAGSPSSSNRQMGRMVSDRAFIQKHIEEIDRRDERIAQLDTLISDIKTTTQDVGVRHLITEFEKTYSVIFTGEFTKLDLGSPGSASPPGSADDAAKLQQTNQELEIVMQEQAHQIEMLRKRTDELTEVIEFNESDHLEMGKLIDEQHEFIQTLKERNLSLERKIKDLSEGKAQGPRLSRESLGSLLDLLRRETASMGADELKESGWEHRIAEVAAVLDHERAAGPNAKASAEEIAELEAEVYAIQGV
ncbi:kinesin motor domain-containing protein [Entophlyctis helioformis]|nr:kinesin motor domain-containing protein [Entophlyctis helioformis]